MPTLPSITQHEFPPSPPPEPCSDDDLEKVKTIICKASCIAQYYLNQGDDAKAAQYIFGVARLKRITFGSLHPDTLSSFFTLGMMMYRNQQYPAAEAILRNVRMLRRKLHGSNHLLTLRTGK